MITNNGDLLLETFKKHGVEYIFCSPGTEWSPVWEGLVKRYTSGDNSMKYVNCRHEALAVTAALGYVKATGKIPAVLLHTNVGTLNASMAIRTVYWAQSPMLICCGDSSTFGAQNENSLQWLNRLSDIGRPNNLVRRYVKWNNEVLATETMVDSIYRGCQIANSVPQGPSFISIPHELMLKETTINTVPVPYKVTELPAPIPDEVKEVTELLLRSKLPVIITENLGKTPRAVPRLVELAELLGMPVFESADPTFHNFPKDHPLHLGIDPVAALNEADMVFVAGCQTPWHPPAKFPKNGTKVIFLDEHPIKEKLPYWGYQVDITIKADVEKWLTSLLDALHSNINKSKIDPDLVKERFNLWEKKHTQFRDKLEKEAMVGKNNTPISAKYFFYLSNKLLPKDCIVMSEATTHENLIRTYLTNPTQYFKCQYGGLGVGLGTSAGFKLGNPDKPVILFVGDGAFNYNPVVASLGLCQEYNLPIMVIVLNNGGYMAMKYAHQRIYPEGDSVKSNTFLGTSISSAVDYCKIAQGFDSYSEKITRPEQIEGAVTRALEQLGKARLTLLDVVMD